MSVARKLGRAYAYVATSVLGALILLAVLNAGAAAIHVMERWLRGPSNPVMEAYGPAKLQAAYPGMSLEEVTILLHETWERTAAYDPVTEFRERPFRGTYVNVDPRGFRLSKDQAPWPPPSNGFTIFLFGGSTTFGYGLPDSQTIASHLQDFLRENLQRVNVYNFGSGMYELSQERARFEQLLIEGYVPNMAIFVDGLNEFAFHSGSDYTKRLQSIFDESTNPTSNLAQFANNLSLVRAMRALSKRLATHSSPQLDSAESTANSPASLDEIALVTKVIDQYLSNQRMARAVAHSYSVVPVFVWQPIPTYRYDLNHHLFARRIGDFATGVNRHSALGYSRFAERVSGNPGNPDFIWCADFQENLAEPLYVAQSVYRCLRRGVGIPPPLSPACLAARLPPQPLLRLARPSTSYRDARPMSATPRHTPHTDDHTGSRPATRRRAHAAVGLSRPLRVAHRRVPAPLSGLCRRAHDRDAVVGTRMRRSVDASGHGMTGTLAARLVGVTARPGRERGRVSPAVVTRPTPGARGAHGASPPRKHRRRSVTAPLVTPATELRRAPSSPPTSIQSP